MIPLTYLAIRIVYSYRTWERSHPLIRHIEEFVCTKKCIQLRPRRDSVTDVLAYSLVFSLFRRGHTVHFNAHDTHIMQLFFSYIGPTWLRKLESEFILLRYTINLSMR